METGEMIDLGYIEQMLRRNAGKEGNHPGMVDLETALMAMEMTERSIDTLAKFAFHSWIREEIDRMRIHVEIGARNRFMHNKLLNEIKLHLTNREWVKEGSDNFICKLWKYERESHKRTSNSWETYNDDKKNSAAHPRP